MSPVTVTVVLGEGEIVALDRYIDEHRPGRSRAEAVAEIVALWAGSQGSRDGAPDEGMRPEELNASNDS
ncbi:hypothetical protein [Bosea thiooxidans]